ncbi:MAG: hypothetical protein WAW11_02465 [Patescibacteria group bacterium]
MTTIIVLTVLFIFFIFMSTKVRINQNKKPTVPGGLSDDLSMAKSQLEIAYPDNLGFITNIIRGKIQQTGISRVIQMHFADGFKYVQLNPDENVYCVERLYAEIDDEDSDGYTLLELYTKGGNLLSYFTASACPRVKSPFRSMPFLFNLLPNGYSFEPSKEPGDLLYK